MIRTFKSKPLLDLFEKGRSSRIDARLRKRILVRLDAIDEASSIDDLKMTGYNFHALKGFSPTRYTIYLNGPWCITFEFAGGDAFHVDFEQYH